VINVVDQVSGLAINIEVVGNPHQYRLRTGTWQKWEVNRGRYKGRQHEGVRWGHPSYHMSLKLLLEYAIKSISESEGLPISAISLSNKDEWQKLVEMEDKRLALIDKVAAEYQHVLSTYGKKLETVESAEVEEEVDVEAEAEVDVEAEVDAEAKAEIEVGEKEEVIDV
jgi:hypothetical protein